MITLRAGRHMAAVATRRSALAVPLRSFAAPSSGTVSRPGVARRRITLPKRSSTSGPGDKAGGDAAKASEAAEAGAESKAEGATEAAAEGAAEKAAPSAEGAPAAEVPPSTQGRNMVVGLALVGFAVGAYYYTINKMKTQDHLADVEKEAEEEAMVNLHESGLKISPKVVPEAVTQAKGEAPVQAVAVPVEAAAVVVEAVAVETPKEDTPPAPAAESPEGKKKKKGWRRYIFFGRRSGGD